MTGDCLITRTGVARFVGDFPDRESCVHPLGLPVDRVADRDPDHDDAPRLWLKEAPDALPRDGDRHPL